MAKRSKKSKKSSRRRCKASEERIGGRCVRTKCNKTEDFVTESVKRCRRRKVATPQKPIISDYDLGNPFFGEFGMGRSKKSKRRSGKKSRKSKKRRSGKKSKKSRRSKRKSGKKSKRSRRSKRKSGKKSKKSRRSRRSRK